MTGPRPTSVNIALTELVALQTNNPQKIKPYVVIITKTYVTGPMCLLTKLFLIIWQVLYMSVEEVIGCSQISQGRH